LSTQEQIAGLGHNNDNKKFRYTLSSSNYGTLTMTNVPKGWQDGELTFIRDPKYKGVIESYSTTSFEFVKKARDYIQKAYDNFGIDYEIKIFIDIQINSTFKYARYFTGKLDLSTYGIDSTSVKCEIINTGFQNAILNRDDIDVDLLNTKFIGGGTNSMEQIAGMPSDLTLDSYTAQANADWKFSIFNIRDARSGSYSHYVPMVIQSSEFESGEVRGQSFDSTDVFFVSVAERTVDFVGNVKVRMIQNFQTSANDFSIQMNLNLNGSSIKFYSDSITDVEEVVFEFDINELGIDLVPGDELSLTATSSGPNYYSITYLDSAVSLNETLQDTLPEILIPGYPVYEFTTRILQLYSGETNPLYSDWLGRTDSSPETYSSDGGGALLVFTKGQWIRQFPIEEDGAILQTINGSLSKIFNTLNATQNIGLGFEVIGGVNKVRIEEEKYFFDVEENPDVATDGKYWKVNQILDLSEHLNDEVISKEVLPDWYANEIESGYSNFEYENIQGLKEFNTKSTYATPIKSVKNKLNLVSDYRFDTQGVNKLRDKEYNDTATEDVKGDSNVFGFDVKRDTIFVAKTDDDFALVSGGVDPTQSYNLFYTPRRNTERHGSRISSMRLAQGDEVQWMKSDKNTKLVTRLIGEVLEKPENGDIIVSSLTVGYWIPEAYITEAPVDEETIAAIQANPRGVIKLGTNKYGWILEVQSNNESNKGQFKLLRVDLDNTKVIV